MTFLAPALLALGLAVAVPIALHLLQRHQGPKVVFPAIRYLRRAERESASRMRLRQRLLLALRVAALVLLALAAARPFLPLGGRGHHPTAVVIVLDNSLAAGAVVDDRRVLDHLKDAALATLEAAGPEDRVWLIRAAEPWIPAATGPADAVAAAVRATGAAATSADLAAQVERAASILAAEPDHRAREIHLLSDLRAAAFAVPTAEPAADVPLVVLRPPVAVESNRAVTAVQVGGGVAPLAGEPSSIAVTVQGFGAAAEPGEDSVAVRLIMDGEVRAAARAPVGSAATLPLAARPAGIAAGRVEIDGDLLVADDRRYFATEVRTPPRVRLTGPAPFVEEALSVLEDAGRLRLAPGGPVDVLVAPGAVGVDAVRAGAHVMVLPPATAVELGAANQRLAAAGIPRRFGRPAGGEARLDPEGSGLESVLEGVRLRQAYPLEPVGEPGDSVLARLETGEAWAVAGATDGGRYVVLGTPLTPEAGTIPTSAAMLPLVDRAATAWAAGRPDGFERRPGEVVTLPAADSVVRPDGGIDRAVDGSVYRLGGPGIYRVLHGDSVVAALAVNPPAAASDIRRVDPNRVGELLAGREVRVADARGWGGAIFRQRLGRDLALPFLAAAVLILLAEAAFAAAGRRSGTRQGEPSLAADASAAGKPA